jgi:polysaccharide deacetylase 2 family uncharacterized protein YibQ
MKRGLLIFLISLLTVVTLLTFGFAVKGYFFDKNDSNKLSVGNMSKKEQNSSNSTSEISRLETTILEVRRASDNNISPIATEIEDYINSKKFIDIAKKEPTIKKPSCKVKKDKKKRIKKSLGKEPVLSIIMDDISKKSQLDKLKALNIPITPSIFPSTALHPDTPELAKELKHFLVHTPMEAFNFKREEENTLRVEDSIETIEEKISKIKRDFPNLIAINNHTGSKFTSDAKSMDRLFCVLDKFGIEFIDSRTSVATKTKQVAKLHNREILSRDFFLDNEPDTNYILSQIKKSIKYAKKHGKAIAICHPREETFKALERAKKLFKDLKLVYVDYFYSYESR